MEKDAYIAAGRRHKVGRIVGWLHGYSRRAGVPLDALLDNLSGDSRFNSDEWWEAIAYVAGVKKPSEETREMVRAELRKATGNMNLFDTEDEDPFAGLG